MKNLKLKKRLLSIMSAIFCLMIICTCVAFAESASVNIYTNETIKHTAAIKATDVMMSGHNNASSSNYLYFTAQYTNTDGKWKDGESLLIQKGYGFDNYQVKDTHFDNPTNWRLELNPYALWGGCSGSGTISGM